MLTDQPHMQAHELELSGIFSHLSTYKAIFSRHSIFDQFLRVLSSAHKYVNVFSLTIYLKNL